MVMTALWFEATSNPDQVRTWPFLENEAKLRSSVGRVVSEFCRQLIRDGADIIFRVPLPTVTV